MLDVLSRGQDVGCLWQTFLYKTFYTIDPTEGLSEILDAEQANGKDPIFSKTAPPTPSIMGSNSGSYPIC
jgi:hypothetical protein